MFNFIDVQYRKIKVFTFAGAKAGVGVVLVAGVGTVGVVGVAGFAEAAAAGVAGLATIVAGVVLASFKCK